MAFRLGVDVGGTFTDLFLVGDDGSGTQYRVKTPSTPADPSQGVLVGVRRICEESGVAVGDLQNILHGTTVATNAVLESKGARVGLITTQGFAQILHLARSQTPGPLAGWIIMEKPDPPASLADTREAIERMGPRGETVVEVDEAQVEGIVRDLVESGVESLTVGLINSYVNPAHEERIGEIVERLYPGFPVTLSAHVLPEFREYERTLTACMNSYVRPKVATYIERPPEGAEGHRRDRRREHPPLRRRADDDDGGDPQPDLRDPLRAVRRRRRRALRRPEGGLRGHPHLRHGRHVDRRRALPGRRADDRPRDLDQPPPDQGAVGQRPHRRRGRRLDRARAGAHEGAARRPAVGRRGPRARVLRPRRHRSRR